MTRFDWPVLMRAGLYDLRLKPWEFWALTPAELRLMLGVNLNAGPMTQKALTDLMKSFPDGMPKMAHTPSKENDPCQN